MIDMFFTIIDILFFGAMGLLYFWFVSDCLSAIRGFKIKEILRNKHIHEQLVTILKFYFFWFSVCLVGWGGWQAVYFLYQLYSRQ